MNMKKNNFLFFCFSSIDQLKYLYLDTKEKFALTKNKFFGFLHSNQLKKEFYLNFISILNK